jgi:N6-adenosine-specific RNA methylase IME4
MTLDDIKALPVQTLAARDCVLFLWAIDTHIPEALEVITAWGFRYKSVAFTWVKTTSTGKYAIGCGWWTRANTETCLLATRGKPRPQAKDVRRLVVSPRREHSRKPDEIYDTHIPRLCTGPYIELFARTTRIGWDRAFSNEENKFD